MDSQDVKRRTKDADQPDTTTDAKNEDMRTKREKRMAMAKRGIKSLGVAVALPLALSLFNIYFFGSRNGYGNISKPFWFPPMWALHFACLSSTFLMGLSAWLVWAEGGFHKEPTTLSLYLAQLGLSFAWEPIVFRMGATWFGLVVCLAMFGALVGCSRKFMKLNPIAGDLVKPSLAWATVVAIVNLKLALV
ncbi:translocator protein homolog [Manihot esculenta]|uniref:Peripheral-type benzodiazepine receptor n=1 Tax=Manihot esculenta TaxID=3983 RepID=A0A2C9VTT9_MANES|nr:translocator protein homolog [Manihot esculenta]OAY49535.1 hypothetical protein MANES_05G063900v8 [Manihot esculenta]